MFPWDEPGPLRPEEPPVDPAEAERLELLFACLESHLGLVGVVVAMGVGLLLVLLAGRGG